MLYFDRIEDERVGIFFLIVILVSRFFCLRGKSNSSYKMLIESVLWFVN